MPEPRAHHPLLYEIQTRPWLAELSATAAAPLGVPLTLAGVPEEELDRIGDLGVDAVWLMGVWQTGPLGTEVARNHPGLQTEYRRALPDFTPADVTGSPYAIARYAVDERLGGREALAELRRRLARRGIRLVLDFVVNHTGIDFPWVRERPDLYIQGGPDDLRDAPSDFFAVETAAGPRVLAHGRDPYFPGWTDTAQLNLLSPGTRAGLRAILEDIAGQCDGVRCDMAMLALTEVFRRTWEPRLRDERNRPPAGAVESEVWPGLVAAARAVHPGFLFLAEVYWGLEERVRAQGFQYTYDKTLYDRLAGGRGEEVRRHLQAGPAFQEGSARFLENHDEPRAAAVFPWDRHRAAAVVAATLPGLLLLHEGQLEGRRVRLPIQLRRRPQEPADPEVQAFYQRLLRTLRDPVFRRGAWHLLSPRPAWDGNPTWQDVLAWCWTLEGRTRLVAVHFAPHQGQCYVPLERPELAGREVELRDLLGGAVYVRPGAELDDPGLYLDLPPFGHHLFEVTPRVA